MTAQIFAESARMKGLETCKCSSFFTFGTDHHLAPLCILQRKSWWEVAIGPQTFHSQCRRCSTRLTTYRARSGASVAMRPSALAFHSCCIAVHPCQRRCRFPALCARTHGSSTIRMPWFCHLGAAAWLPSRRSRSAAAFFCASSTFWQQQSSQINLRPSPVNAPFQGI